MAMTAQSRRLVHIASFLAFTVGVLFACGLFIATGAMPELGDRSVRVDALIGVLLFFQVGNYLKAVACVGDCIPTDPSWEPHPMDNRILAVGAGASTVAILVFGVAVYTRAGVPPPGWLPDFARGSLQTYARDRAAFHQASFLALGFLQVATLMMTTVVARRFEGKPGAGGD